MFLFRFLSTRIRRNELKNGRKRKRRGCSNRLAQMPPCNPSYALWLCLHTAQPHRSRFIVPLTTLSFLLPYLTTHKAACGPVRARSCTCSFSAAASRNRHIMFRTGLRYGSGCGSQNCSGQRVNTVPQKLGLVHATLGGCLGALVTRGPGFAPAASY